MAGVDLRTVAKLMGHSSIQISMRYAHLAAPPNRAAVDRLGPLQSRTAAKRGNELVTKSVTGKNATSRRTEKNSINHLKTMQYNKWPRSSGG